MEEEMHRDCTVVVKRCEDCGSIRLDWFRGPPPPGLYEGLGAESPASESPILEPLPGSTP